MTTISGPVKPVDDYPDVSQATAAYADSVICVREGVSMAAFIFLCSLVLLLTMIAV
jgi:hypothetical protein